MTLRLRGRSFLRCLLTCMYAIMVVGVVVARSAVAADDAAFQAPPIQVPEGYTVELVAGPPLVRYPMLAGFDERGRLYVCESAGLNLDAEALLEQLPNFIRRIEDTDGDGRFDASTIFADKMTFPSGVLCQDGVVFAASPPYLWRFEDRDGDGVAEHREQVLGKFTFRGHAGDVHGPFRAPDGRLFLTDGIMGHELVDRDGKLFSKGNTGRAFALNPDGTGLETYCGGGMANPIALAFNETGEAFCVMTFFNPDTVRHDALAHFVYGGVYPRRHPGLVRDFKHTGPLMPALLKFGIQAPSGVLAYRGQNFGPHRAGDLFVSYFNSHSVSRVRLTRAGATFAAAEEPFLTSPSADFHPCQIVEDADGSLLVIDTGGWFKIGCSTTQTALPQILGGIYRIRRTDAPRHPDPRGLLIDRDQSDTAFLAQLLGDERHAVSDRAIATLALRGVAAVPTLQAALSEKSLRARRNAVWTLTRIAQPAARDAVRKALADSDEGVRQCAASGAGLHRDAGATQALMTLVQNDSSAAVRRDSATALGRIGSPTAVPALLEALRQPSDRFLEHALIYALIEINNGQALQGYLTDSSPRVRRGALVALDQMGARELTLDAIQQASMTTDQELQEAVLRIVVRHPDWGDAAAGVIEQWLLQAEQTPDRQKLLYEVLGATYNRAPIERLVGELLARQDVPTAGRQHLLKMIQDSSLPELPAAWRPGVVTCLEAADPDLVNLALAALSTKNSSSFEEVLLRLVRDTERSMVIRIAAAAAIAGHPAPLSPELFELLTSQLSLDASYAARAEATRALGVAQLSVEQVAALWPALAQAGPLEFPGLLSAVETVPRAEFGPQLVASLRTAPGAVSVPQERLAAVISRFPPEVQAQATPVLEQLTREAAEKSLIFAGHRVYLQGGNEERGRQVFQGKTAACAACHKVAGQGTEIGPDLSRIGEVRNRRDMLESILLPSASLARGYEPVTVATQSGRVIVGVVAAESAETVVLRTAQREEIRIPRSEIEEIVPSKVSIMPAGLYKLITPDELRDLLAYLATLKAPPR